MITRKIYPKILYNTLPDGWFEYTSVLGYWKLIDSINDNSTIIECGNYKGRSICSIAPYIIHKKLKVYCIDIDEYNVIKTLKNNLKHYKINEYVKVLTDDIFNLINEFNNNSVDLILIDSFYDFKNLSKLIKLIKPKLKNEKSILCGQLGLKNPKDVFTTLDSVFTDYNKLFLQQGNDSGLWYAYKKDYK